jgi:eukaryotic-like serine/threonine-protein kinase
MKVNSFFRSMHFWKHLALIVVAGFVFIWLTMFFLRIYTFHGQSIEVPDFSGKTMKEVKELRESRHYNFVIVDSVYDNSKVPGSVVSQLPLPGSHVKKGRTVYLTTIAFTAEKTKLPNLVDFTSRQASALLETHGLKVGKIEFVPDVGQTVIKAKYKGKEIPWGTVINKGEKIDLVIGKGKGATDVYVPKLVGKKRAKAIQMINEAGFNVGSEIFANPKDTVNVRVVKQRPKYEKDKEINMGESIDLWYE